METTSSASGETEATLSWGRSSQGRPKGLQRFTTIGRAGNGGPASPMLRRRLKADPPSPGVQELTSSPGAVFYSVVTTGMLPALSTSVPPAEDLAGRVAISFQTPLFYFLGQKRCGVTPSFQHSLCFLQSVFPNFTSDGQKPGALHVYLNKRINLQTKGGRNCIVSASWTRPRVSERMHYLIKHLATLSNNYYSLILHPPKENWDSERLRNGAVDLMLPCWEGGIQSSTSDSSALSFPIMT